MKSVLVAMALLVAVSAHAGGDAAAGKAKAVTCVACHGMAGISNNELWPNLAGQKVGYMIKQMKAFKDGTRTEPMMAPMMAPLNDQDIENLAAYFNSLGK